MEKIRVLVADDHPVFREGVCLFLKNEEDIEVVAKAAEGEEAIRLAKELLPDVAIIDIAMPGIDGIDVARQIKVTCPSIAVLMLSAFDYEQYILASLRVGVAGYLLKTSPMDELVNSIRLVYSGEAVFTFKSTSEVLRRLVTDGNKTRKKTGELSQHEIEVLKLAGRGMSNREIAEKSVISERTVQTHLINIFRKLNVGSRTEAVLRALKEGWFIFEDLS